MKAAVPQRGDVRERYACPDCGGRLRWEAALASSDCGARFPVVDGVLVIERRPGVQASYFARAWRGSRPGALSVATRRRLSLFPRVLDGAILEIGAGDAALARTHRDHDIVSADLVLEGIADLGARAAVFPVGRAPFRPHTFDVVVAFEVLEHLTDAEREAAIREVVTLLKAGGAFLLSVPTWPVAWLERALRGLRHRTWPTLANLDRWDFPHQARFERGVLEGQLAGLEVVGTRRWARSGSALATCLLNPVLRRVGAEAVDLTWIDRLLPFDHCSNQVVLARTPRAAGDAALERMR